MEMTIEKLQLKVENQSKLLKKLTTKTKSYSIVQSPDDP